MQNTLYQHAAYTSMQNTLYQHAEHPIPACSLYQHAEHPIPACRMYQITDIKEITLVNNHESPDYRQNSSENVTLMKLTANECLIIDEKL
jgi:hypothetical protein